MSRVTQRLLRTDERVGAEVDTLQWGPTSQPLDNDVGLRILTSGCTPRLSKRPNDAGRRRGLSPRAGRLASRITWRGQFSPTRESAWPTVRMAGGFSCSRDGVGQVKRGFRRPRFCPAAGASMSFARPRRRGTPPNPIIIIPLGPGRCGDLWYNISTLTQDPGPRAQGRAAEGVGSAFCSQGVDDADVA